MCSLATGRRTLFGRGRIAQEAERAREHDLRPDPPYARGEFIESSPADGAGWRRVSLH